MTTTAAAAVAVEFRAPFFSVVLALLLFLLLLAAFDTFDDFFAAAAGSFVLPLEADCLELSLDLPELSITTWPAIEDNELLVCRPVDLAADFFD